MPSMKKEIDKEAQEVTEKLLRDGPVTKSAMLDMIADSFEKITGQKSKFRETLKKLAYREDN